MKKPRYIRRQPSDDMPADLLRRGYKRDGRRVRVDPDHHLVRTHGNAPAFDVRALAYWEAVGVRKLTVELTTGEKWSIELGEFMRNSEPLDRGFGKQRVCYIGLWARPTNPNQTEMFAL